MSNGLCPSLELMREIGKRDTYASNFASVGLLDDRDFVLEAAKVNPPVSMIVRKEYKNRGFVEETLKNEGLIF